jgi:U3 small nucleolar ribonucleoprotein protein IMP4
MNLREAFLKAKEFGFDSLMVISERDGNPSRLDFFTGNEEPEAYLLISTDLSQPPGKVQIDNLILRCEEPKLSVFLSNFFKVRLVKENLKDYSNLIWVKKTETLRTVMEFYDNKGNLIRPRIYLKDWKGVALK